MKTDTKGLLRHEKCSFFRRLFSGEPLVCDYAHNTYTAAVELKSDALRLMDLAAKGAVATDHLKQIADLEERLAVQVTRETEKGDQNMFAAKQWKLMAAKEGHLLGGWLEQWKSGKAQSQVFVLESAITIGRCFDSIIKLERAKQRQPKADVNLHPEKQASPRSFFEKWIVWRVPCLCLWYWVVGAFVHHASGANLLPGLGWVALTPVLSLIYFVLRKAWANCVGFLFYLIVFPVAFFCWALWLFIRALSAQWRLFSISTSDIAAGVCLLFLAVIWACIWTFSPNHRPLMIIIDVTLLFLLQMWSLRWASNPLRPVCTLVVGLWDASKALMDKIYIHPALRTKAQDKLQNARSIIDSAETVVTKVFNNIEHTLTGTLLPLAITVFFSIFGVVVTGYAFAIYGGQRIAHTAFIGLSPQSPFPMCWLYSLTAITFSRLEGVRPVTELGYCLFAAELLSAILLLTVFFGVFSVAAGVHSGRRVEELKSSLQAALEWLRQKRQELSDSETPATTPSENATASKM